MKALILLGHGSRSAGAGDAMERIACALAQRQAGCRVSTAWLEISRPSLAEAIDRCAAQGADEVVVVPYLLLMGTHLQEGVPRLLAEAGARHPGLRLRLAPHLGFDQLLVDLVARRAAEVADPPSGPGTVFLVGAGPGDPLLITVKGRELIAGCDCLVHDRLVHPGLIALAPAGAEVHDVGKTGHHANREQMAINDLLLDCAQRRRRVVRLKGGDPFLFGRGWEEADFLARHGIPWVEVPGVSSGFAAPAAAGIPLTHRGCSASVALVTGYRQAGDPRPPDWDGLRGVDTLVIFMGMHNLAGLVASLLASGRPPQTPAAVIERGTWEGQRQVFAPLSDLVQAVATAQLGAPAIVVVGAVAGLTVGGPVGHTPPAPPA